MTNSLTTMPAVVQFGLQPGEVELREVAVPQPAPDEVLLKVAAVSVCGSDVHQYHATHSWTVNIPVTLGHEFAGTVAALGSAVHGFKEGDRVVSETAARICGTCALCRSGNYHLCPHRMGYGYGVDGAMTKFVRAPARCLHHLPSNIPFHVAALTEPCCVAYNAVVGHARIRPGDSVLVLGPGPIGLLCLHMAKLCGAGPLITAGLQTDEPRMQAASALGATHQFVTDRDDWPAFAAGIADGLGVDVVIDAAGVSATFALAMEAVRPQGQIVKVGWGRRPLDCSLDPLVAKAVTVSGSFSHHYTIWERVLAMLSDGTLQAASLIGLRSPLQEWETAFQSMHAGRILKAVLEP